MRRRDFVKGVVAVPVSATTLLGQTAPVSPQQEHPNPLTPSGQSLETSSAATSGFNYRTQPIPTSVPDAFAVTESRFFSSQQMATLRRLGDVLLPPMNGYPGSSQSGTPEFLDFLLGSSPPERKHLYISGLDRLNSESEQQFGIPFAQLSPDQADRLIRPWLRAWMQDHPPVEPFADFINIAHHDIRTATMNSRAWSIAATSSGERAPGMGLYWSPIDPDIEKYV